MRTVTRSGFRWDVGGHLLWPSYGTALGLAERTDPPVPMRRLTPTAAVVAPGFVRHYVSGRRPGGPALGLIRNPAVGARTKLGFARAVLRHLPRQRMFDMHHPERAAALDDGRSLRSWGDAAVGREAVNYLLEPISSALMLWSPEETPWWAAMRMVLRVGPVVVPRDGVGSFARALARPVTALTGARVTAVVPLSGGRVRVRLSHRGAAAAHTFDRVVVATPAPVAREIVADPAHALGDTRASYLTETEYVRGAQAAFCYDSVVEDRAVAVAIPAPLGQSAACTTWEQVASPAAAPPGCSVASVYPSHAYTAARWGAPGRDFLHDMAQSMESVYPAARDRCVVRDITFWEHAMPILAHGRQDRLVHALEQGPPTDAMVFACGDYWEGPSMEMSMASGLRAARELLGTVGLSTSADRVAGAA
jgi:predicted NAD/FAD-dependent oxidoreductase